MIIVKPKLNTVFSMVVFILFLLGLGSWMFWLYYLGKSPAFYQFAIMVFALTLAISLLVKFLWNWKNMEIGKERFVTKFPFRWKEQILLGKNLIYWEEVVVKTWGGNYAELVLFFEPKLKITLSKQEHDGYGQLHKYLVKKYSKKRK